MDESKTIRSYTCKTLNNNEQRKDEILNIPISDKMNTRSNDEPQFNVSFPRREEWLSNNIKLTGKVFYTDG